MPTAGPNEKGQACQMPHAISDFAQDTGYLRPLPHLLEVLTLSMFPGLAWLSGCLVGRKTRPLTLQKATGAMTSNTTTFTNTK